MALFTRRNSLPRMSHVAPLVRETMANDMPHDERYHYRLARSKRIFV